MIENCEYWSMCYYKQLIGFYDNLRRIKKCTLGTNSVEDFMDICWYAYNMSSGRIPIELQKDVKQNEILFQGRFGKWIN